MRASWVFRPLRGCKNQIRRNCSRNANGYEKRRPDEINRLRIFKEYLSKLTRVKKIIKLLNSLGSSFDCASIGEIESCISAKVSPKRISYGSTLKKECDIEKAFKLGINLYAFDSYEELCKISKKAPSSDVFCRLMVPNGGAEWPLSKKFGCSHKTAEKLILEAKKLGLNPIGISFHVGSQQLSLETWKMAEL